MATQYSCKMNGEHWRQPLEGGMQGTCYRAELFSSLCRGVLKVWRRNTIYGPSLRGILALHMLLFADDALIFWPQYLQNWIAQVPAQLGPSNDWHNKRHARRLAIVFLTQLSKGSPRILVTLNKNVFFMASKTVNSSDGGECSWRQPPPSGRDVRVK